MLGRFVLKDGTSTHQMTLVHIATNSIHFHWVTEDDGTSSLHRLQCQLCHEDLTMRHLLFCPDHASQRVRDYFQAEIIDHFHQFDDCQPWIRSLVGHLQLPQLLAKLFPPSISVHGEGINDHILRCFVGAISTSELRHASTTVLKFQDPNIGRIALNQFRLLQLTNIHTVYSKLKNTAS